MKHVPRYVKRSLREALEAYTQQESEVLKAKLLLEEVNLKIIEVFCPVKIGDLFQENYLIRVQRIAWHYIDSPLGIYWELSGTVVKDDGTPDNRFTGSYTCQCYEHTDRYWKEKAREADPSRFIGDCTCQIGTVHEDRILIASEDDCPVHGYGIDGEDDK